MNHPESIGRYRILRLLGSGAMGDVYLAEDPNIDRELAIKTVRVVGGTPDDVADRKQRLLREARAAGKFVHPNVVTLFDADESDGTLYLAFEYVPPGIDLAQRMIQGIKQGPPVTLRQALRWVREIAQALQFAHDRNIVHRDIKPSNVLIAEDGTAKVADFGIAKLLGPGTELTRTGSVVGSPQYMSPEQVRGETLDGRSDVFSLGVVFYELLCGIRPFGGETLSTLVFEILSKEPPPVGSLRPSLPGDLVALAHRMLAKDRNHRCAAASEVVESIRRLETSVPAHMLDDSATPSDVDETRRMATAISAQIDAQTAQAAQPAQSAEAPTVHSSAQPAPSMPPTPPVPSAPPTAAAVPTQVDSQVGIPTPPPLAASQVPPQTPSPAMSTSLPPRGGGAQGAGSKSSNTLRNVALGLGVIAVLAVLLLVGIWFVVKSLAPGLLPPALGGSETEQVAQTDTTDSTDSTDGAPETETQGRGDEQEPASDAEAAREPRSAEPSGEAASEASTSGSSDSEDAALEDLRNEVAQADREPPTSSAQSPEPVPPPLARPPDPEPRTEPVSTSPSTPSPTSPPPSSPPSPSSAEPEPELPRADPEPAVDRDIQDWQAAASRVNREMSTGLHFRFDIKPKDLYVIVRVWPKGEGSIVKGAAENFKDGRKGQDMTLPGSGDHLVQLLINGEVQHSILVHAVAGGQTTTISLDFR